MGKLNAKVGESRLPEVLDLAIEDKARAVILLEKAAAIKGRIGVKPDEKKGSSGSGLLRELSECLYELGCIQLAGDLDGIRHNKIKFTMRQQDGRSSLDVVKLGQELVMRGVDVKVVKECMEAATKVGEPYFVRELEELK